jgi:EmrB/QacA subfamily drug resistance transporter
VRSRRWWLLAAICLPTAITEFDETVMSVALPAIDEELDATLVSAQWTVTAYVLAFASLLLIAGRLAEVFGPRKLFGIGTAIMLVGTVGCVFSPSIDVLVVARIVQGAGAALLTPAAFALVILAFGAESKRGFALGLWTAAVAVGAAIGPPLGGALIELFGWEAVFVLGLPAGVIGLAGTLWLSPADPPEHGAMPPLGPATAIAAGLALVLFGLSESEALGWIPVGGGALIVGLTLLSLGARRDARDDDPLLRLSLLRRPAYAAVSAVVVLGAVAWLALILLQGLYLSGVRDASPLEAGLQLAPLTLGAIVTAPLSGHLVGRLGTRTLIAAGCGAFLVSLVLLALTDARTSYVWQLLVAYSLVGIGWGLMQTPMEIEAVDAAGEERASFVSGFLGLLYQVGAGLGVAASTAALAGLGVEDLPGPGQRAEFMDALTATMAGGAVLIAIALALTLWLIPGRGRAARGSRPAP